jgi:hypothetical protein
VVPEFETNEQAVQWVDAWVADRTPSPLFLVAGEREREHFALLNQEYGRFIVQFEVEFTALAELTDRINFADRSEWPEHRSVQYVLLAYNAKTFLSAVDRLVKGYYEDSITLTRSLYETFIRMLFVSCYPDDAYSVIGKPPRGVRQFNLTGFLRTDLELEWETTYGLMSTFAHSNSYQVMMALKRAIDREGDPERFGVTFDYDSRLAEAAMPFLHFVLLAHLRFLVERIVDGTTITDQPSLSTAREAVDFLTYGLVNHPKEYWRNVAADLDLLFKMLALADRREDWKSFLRTTREPPA